jgi:homogentisate phytyltransferase/homogentisate geranylgeranyltransferase
MKAIKTLWAFSRPHTLIGSMISIFTLYMIICLNNKAEHLSLLLFALAVGICCNIFIVGINQIADVEIDKINKPYLPIPAGTLSIQNAKYITYGSLLLSLGVALYLSLYLFFIILLAGAIGWAYSMPPIYLKRHHFTAALAITFVRGILINVGGFLVFNYLVNRSINLPNDVKILTLFILVFSVVISWFKDLPDVKGDSAYQIKTLAILYSPKPVFIAGTILISLSYLLTIFLKYPVVVSSRYPLFRDEVLFYGNIALLLLFVANSLTINLAEHRSVKKFYKRFWWFFFAEYLVYLIAYL